MKNLKKLIATVTLTGIIIIGATNARAGLMLSDFVDGDQEQSQPCQENNENKVDWGIIITNFGIIITNIIGMDDNTETNCGIIITN